MSKRSSKVKDYADPIDDQEQEKIIQDGIEAAKSLGKRTRRNFFFVFLFCMALYLFALAHNIFYPLTLPHENVFRQFNGMELAFSVHYIFSAICSVATAFILRMGFAEASFAMKSIAVGISVCTMITWGIFYIREGVTNPQLLWIPFGNIGLFLLAYWIDSDAISILREAHNIESYRYEYKKV